MVERRKLALETSTPLRLDSSVDFQFEKYKIDRETEREVYKALHAYEHAGIRALLIINGGAATAFLTFLGTTWNQEFHVLPAFASIFCWSAGLVVAGYAIRQMYEAHRRLARQFRYRRMSEELARRPRWADRYLFELYPDHLVSIADGFGIQYNPTDYNAKRTAITKIHVEVYPDNNDTLLQGEETELQRSLRMSGARKFIEQVVDCEEKYESYSVSGRHSAFWSAVLFAVGVVLAGAAIIPVAREAGVLLMGL